jgi:hypothetical protein
MILKRNSKKDRRRRQCQLLNTGVQVFTDSAHVDALGINLSEVGMRLFAVANLPLGSQIQVEFLPPDARNGFEFVGLFAIALCICTESSFWWTQINAEIFGPMARLQAVRPLSLSEIATDPGQPIRLLLKIPDYAQDPQRVLSPGCVNYPFSVLIKPVRFPRGSLLHCPPSGQLTWAERRAPLVNSHSDSQIFGTMDLGNHKHSAPRFIIGKEIQ